MADGLTCYVRESQHTPGCISPHAVVYHTNRDCQSLATADGVVDDASREALAQRGLRRCRVCAGEVERHTPENSYVPLLEDGDVQTLDDVRAKLSEEMEVGD